MLRYRLSPVFFMASVVAASMTDFCSSVSSVLAAASVTIDKQSSQASAQTGLVIAMPANSAVAVSVSGFLSSYNMYFPSFL